MALSLNLKRSRMHGCMVLTVLPLDPLPLTNPSYSSSVRMPAMCGPIWDREVDGEGGGFLGG